MNKRAMLILSLTALLLLPSQTSWADGGPITDPYVWRGLEEGQQIAVVALNPDGTAHTDLFVSIVDRSTEHHEFTFFVPLGVQAQDVDVQEMKGREFDATYTEALDRRFHEDWAARQTYRDQVTDAVLPGALLLNGGVPAWLSALVGQRLYERRPIIEGDLEAGQVFETPSGRVAVYDMDDSVDVEALIAEEGLPEGVRETLEAVWGQRLAVVTLVTNPEAETGELAPPEPEVKTLRLWDIVSGQEIPTSLVLAEAVHALAFSPDGSHLAVEISGHVIIWNVTADEPVATIAMGGIGAKSLAFSPDNTTLAIAKVRSVELWDVATGTRTDLWEDETLQALGFGEYPDLEQITFSPDGHFLAVAGDQLVVILVSDQSPVFTLNGGEDDEWTVTFSPDGQWLTAVRLPRGEVQLYDTATWAKVAEITERWATYGAAFSPDNAWMAFADHRGQLRLWSVPGRTLEQTLQMDTSTLESLAFSPDGTALSVVDYESTISVWDLASGQLMTRIHLASQLGSANVAAFALDGARVALGYRQRTSEAAKEEAYETGLRLSWTSTMQPGASDVLTHRYPLGTGQSWANPIPLTRVYVVAAPGIGFEAQAPVIGEDYSGFVPGKYGRPRLRIYDAPRNQSAYAMDGIVSPDGQLWRSIYTNANPAEDVVITHREPLALPLHYAPPALARHVWWMGVGVALLAWLLAWRYLMGGIVAVRYTWFGKPFWRDSLYWLTAGHVRSLAFLPFLLVGLFAGFEFAGETPAWSSLFYLSPLILLAHGMTAYRFARSVHQPAETFDWLRNKAFWGFLVVAVVSNVLYMALVYAAVVYLGGIE